MRWRNWLKLIGLVLLVWIMSTIDWEQATQTLLKLNPAYLLGYLVFFVAMMFVRTIRLRIALSKLGHQLAFIDCYVATLEPAFMGVVTPGRLGEFTRVGYMHANGVPMPKAIVVVIVERLIDIAVLLLFGAGGMVYIFAPASSRFSGGVVVALGLLLFFGAIHGYGNVLRYLQKYLGWILRWEPSFMTHHRKALTSSFNIVMEQSAKPIFLISLACIAMNLTQIFFLAKAFGLQADYLVVLFAYAVATLISLLPISVGGLGTREATYIMIMGHAGILKEQALVFSLMDGVVLSILGLFMLTVPVWMWRLGKG